MLLDMSAVHLTIHQAMDWLKGQFKPSKKPIKRQRVTLMSVCKFSLPIQNHTTCDHRPVPSTITSKTSAFDLMVPDFGSRVQKNQERQKMAHDGGVKVRSFRVGDAVFVENFNGSPKWIAGRVIANRGPLSLTIQLNNGTKVNRHVDHVRLRGMEGEENASLAGYPGNGK